MVEQIDCLKRNCDLPSETPTVADADFQLAETAVSIMRYGGQKRILLMDEVEFQLLEHHFLRAEIVAKRSVQIRGSEHTAGSGKLVHDIGVQNIL